MAPLPCRQSVQSVEAVLTYHATLLRLLLDGTGQYLYKM